MKTMNATSKFAMKSTPLPLLAALFLSVSPVGWAQDARPVPVSSQPSAPPTFSPPWPLRSSQPSQLTKFDLDFKGGTPKELAEAISKSMGRPLNVIIPDEYQDTQMPALKLTEITVLQLFEALSAASQRMVPVITGTVMATDRTPPSQYQMKVVAFGFRTDGNPTDNSIWRFFREGGTTTPDEPPFCRFYQLQPYLGSLKVEDITTAIETGWKMLGETKIPEMRFHKDTGLLIAVGKPNALAVIDNVLRNLHPSTHTDAPAAKAEKP